MTAGTIRAPRTEAPLADVFESKVDTAKADRLREGQTKLANTHQFLSLCSRLKSSHLGAHRMAGVPFTRRLETDAINQMLHALRDQKLHFMLFVGNMGCIEIHGGSVLTVHETGPWHSFLDPDFNIHLRMDRVAEVWAVEKLTQRGPAVSVEAFDADGGLIFQAFGRHQDGVDHREEWNAIVAGLRSPATEEALL